MEQMFLSHDEVVELTGSHRKLAQIEILKRNGIRHTIKRSGWPCVARAAVIGDQGHANEPTAWTPRKAS